MPNLSDLNGQTTLLLVFFFPSSRCAKLGFFEVAFWNQNCRRYYEDVSEMVTTSVEK